MEEENQISYALFPKKSTLQINCAMQKLHTQRRIRMGHSQKGKWLMVFPLAVITASATNLLMLSFKCQETTCQDACVYIYFFNKNAYKLK